VSLGLVLGACGNDTEILISVTRDAQAPAAIPRLRIYAAVANGQQMNGAAVYVDQSDPQADVDVSARDLAASPYKLGLRPGAQLPGDADLQVAALGFMLDDAGDPKPLAFGTIDHAISFANGRVLEFEVSLERLAGPVSANGKGCVDFVVNGQKIHIGAQDDWDCDGDPHATDCNDLDPVISHLATEVCGNDVDEDCSGAIDDDTDADGDGVFACKGDCIDNPNAQLPGGLTAADVHAGADERLDNAIDENCDGMCDVGPVLDTDKDTYTTVGIVTAPSVGGRCMKSTSLIDCDDNDHNIHPGATEILTNGADDDCDGTCDVDADMDGYTPSGYVEPPTMGHCAPIAGDQVDCRDDDKDIHPGAAEICDGIDENCDGKCDDDMDNDGYSVCGTVTQDPTQCVVTTNGCSIGQQCDCAPSAEQAHPVPSGGQPVPERCDGFDENCDGVLYPKTNQCFAPAGAGTCFAGTRECKDDNPQSPWDVCNVDSQQPVDPKLCAAYDACFVDPTIVDPFACAISKAQLGVIGCKELVGNGGVACTPAFYAIPTLVSAGQCANANWRIYGGVMQGAWTVGFGDNGGGGDKATGCTSNFAVTAYDHNLATTTITRILVTQFVGTAAVSVFVDLQPLTSGVCVTPGSNMSCTGP